MSGLGLRIANLFSSIEDAAADPESLMRRPWDMLPLITNETQFPMTATANSPCLSHVPEVVEEALFE
jgi:hypothetical protein